MDNQVRVVVDTVGGDNSPYAMVEGAVNAVKEKSNIKVILVGKQDVLNEELSKYEYDKDSIEVLHAEDEITCHDAPVAAIRSKKQSSMVVGLNYVKEGNADAFVSAGSSGAVLVGGQFIVKRDKGIERTPLAPLIPNANGISLLIDCGANVDARPSHLVQFAQMGSIYMEHVVGISNPRVAIVNIGDEEEKGNALVKETYPLLKACEGINFIGSIEAREIPYGAADVIVTEAFVGNVILKLMEGLSGMLVKEIKSAMMSTTKSKIGGALVKGEIKKTLKRFDATEHGGAPLLGLNGLVVKIHGNASHKEVKNAIIQCVTFKEQRINELIREELLKSKEAQKFKEAQKAETEKSEVQKTETEKIEAEKED